jgi:alpha-galactosidase
MQRRDMLHLRHGGTSVVLDLSTPLPTILWWGEDLGDVADDQLRDLATASIPQRASGGLDDPAPLTLLPQHADGWFGSPGLRGHRTGGLGFSPALRTTDIETDTDEHGSRVVVRAADPSAALAAEIRLTIGAGGVVTSTIGLRNDGDDEYTLDALAVTLPLPPSAREILDTTGRHLHERAPQRHAFTIGTHERSSHKGRPGADATLLLVAGEPGFGFERGIAHAMHVGWSGNHVIRAEKRVTGETLLMGGELLGSGEVVLAPGETYTTPTVYGTWGDGLNDLSARLHEYVRARPTHPARPRPVTLNTWEAVYFDQNFENLAELAEVAAGMGAERFVLDDGWFRGRRDDTTSLGDWYVDETVWPEGLRPLADHVRSLGLEFGLWFEPEMVSLDSDVAREHPDWMLAVAGRTPLPGRQQYVLDVANPAVSAYLLERIDALVTELDIAYIKWDHNRDVVDGASSITGRAGVHEATIALYALFDELRRRHPGLEIESCASGGARVDLGILEHTDRVWTSDCIDPIERLDIQRYTGLLLPPELMGEHVSGPTSHSTGRTLGLDVRAAGAIFGHFGVEWDVREASAEERAHLADWIAAHKRWRDRLHTARTVHVDVTDPAIDIRGAVSSDLSWGLFALTQITTGIAHPPGRFVLAGLDPERLYTVRVPAPLPRVLGPGESPLPWAQDGVTLSGRTLMSVGLQRPILFPQHSILVELTTP